MTKSKPNINNITGVILAGGLAKRMDGQDKGLIKINGQPMINLVIEKLKPQLNHIIINANRNIEQYQTFNLPVIRDIYTNDFYGPLAGMLSAIKATDTDYILTVPCDNPFIPEDLTVRLLTALNNESADVAVVHDGNRMQPVFALIKTSLADSMQQFIDNGDRKIELWYKLHDTVLVDFSDKKEISINLNTPEDLHNIEQKLTQK